MWKLNLFQMIKIKEIESLPKYLNRQLNLKIQFRNKTASLQ